MEFKNTERCGCCKEIIVGKVKTKGSMTYCEDCYNCISQESI